MEIKFIQPNELKNGEKYLSLRNKILKVDDSFQDELNDRDEDVEEINCFGDDDIPFYDD